MKIGSNGNKKTLGENRKCTYRGYAWVKHWKMFLNADNIISNLAIKSTSMKDYAWKIKVSDLLRAPGKEDILHFEKKFIPEDTTITDDGISGTIIVKALDRYSVLLTLEDIHADVMDTSDISGKEFLRHAHNPLYEALFIIPQNEKKHIKGKDEADEYFVINEKDESIDVTECIKNALTAVEPVVKILDGEKMLDSGEDVEIDYDLYV